MKWTVYHVENQVVSMFGWWRTGLGGEEPRWPTDYVPAVCVEAESLEHVWALTNMPERGKEFMPIAPFDRRVRNTSIDDVVEAPTGELYRVEPEGWSRLD